jgi:hypothetical protein
VLVVTGCWNTPDQIGVVKRVERFVQLSFVAFASPTTIIIPWLSRAQTLSVRQQQNRRAIDDESEGLNKAIHEGGKAARLPRAVEPTRFSVRSAGLDEFDHGSRLYPFFGEACRDIDFGLSSRSTYVLSAEPIFEAMQALEELGV